MKLANGKEVVSRNLVGTVDFDLGGKHTSAYFKILSIGIYDRILAMDWLIDDQASIHCT